MYEGNPDAIPAGAVQQGQSKAGRRAIIVRERVVYSLQEFSLICMCYVIASPLRYSVPAAAVAQSQQQPHRSSQQEMVQFEDDPQAESAWPNDRV